MEGLEGGELTAFGGDSDLVVESLELQGEIRGCGLVCADLDDLCSLCNDTADVRDDVVFARRNIGDGIRAVGLAVGLATQLDDQNFGAGERVAGLTERNVAFQTARTLGRKAGGS